MWNQFLLQWYVAQWWFGYLKKKLKKKRFANVESNFFQIFTIGIVFKIFFEISKAHIKMVKHELYSITVKIMLLQEAVAPVGGSSCGQKETRLLQQPVKCYTQCSRQFCPQKHSVGGRAVSVDWLKMWCRSFFPGQSCHDTRHPTVIMLEWPKMAGWWPMSGQRPPPSGRPPTGWEGALSGWVDD